ncbi:MAG TPA: TonB-dependent receptor [Steroidobacteraceae bacterium]|jgi:outer membrane receptor protein involved in Fe transport
MRLAVAIVVAALAVPLFVPGSVSAAPRAETRRTFQIAAQPLSQALLEFSRQADLIVTAPAELVRDKRAPEIRGELQPSAALARLLRGTGLEASFTASGAITIGEARRVAHRRSAERTSVTANTVDAGGDGLIEEVLVTAQKRTENMQDVPASVSVFHRRQLEQLHATTITDYAAYIPGLNVSSGGGPGQTMITLRGIAPVGPGAVVGYYVDDTPLGSSSNYGGAREFGLDLMPYDVERIEVLRGPQGTLYGAGAMGGLLKYVLRRPSVSDLEAWAGASTFDVASASDIGWGLRAGANLPLAADRVGLWGSYFEQQTPGYADNAETGARDLNDVSQRGGRVALLWQINDALSLQLGGLWQRIHSNDDAAVALTLTGLDPPTGIPDHGALTSFHPLPQPFSQDIDHYSATLEWDLGWASLLSASSYSRTRTHHVQDASSIFGFLYPQATGGAVAPGYAPFHIELDLRKRTQELRLASQPGGRIEWLIGAFYTKEDGEHVRNVFALDTAGRPIPQFAPRFLFVEFPSQYEEVAGFGSATLQLAERFDVTAGVRWAHNRQRFRQISGGLESVIGPPTDVSGRSAEDVVTYNVSPRWRASADTMLYARVASGYRPGGPNPRALDLPPIVEADTLTNYEAGLKTQFLAGRAQLNVAAFRIEWREIQQAVIVGGIGSVDNTGNAVSKGFELETAYLPMDELRIGVNAAYTDARLTSPADGIAAARLGNTPRWSASAMLDYELPLASRWTARFNAAWRYVGEQGTAIAAQTGTDNSYVLPSYTALDLSAGLVRGNWTVRLFARNVTDRRAYIGGGLAVDADNVPYGIELNALQPRTVGVSVDVGY